MSPSDLLGADRIVFGPLHIVRQRHLPHHLPACGCLWCTPHCIGCRRRITVDAQIAWDTDPWERPVALCGGCCDAAEKGAA
ncbi:hypothetical protein ACH4FX_12145 [Streptomyces sp. NPDC018019]|uniref:hypothetical protein n=1 Tax=Streptomyces sp. NPDC018019 TaxID=3365030 RepID=UPI0037B9ABF6